MTLKRPEEYDFLDPALQKCPFEFYQSLREHAPVYHQPRPRYWIFTRSHAVLGVPGDQDVHRHLLLWRSVSPEPTQGV